MGTEIKDGFYQEEGIVDNVNLYDIYKKRYDERRTRGEILQSRYSCP